MRSFERQTDGALLAAEASEAFEALYRRHLPLPIRTSLGPTHVNALDRDGNAVRRASIG